MADKKTRKINEDIELVVAEPVSTPSIATAPTGGSDDDGENLSIRASAVSDKIKSGGEKLAGQAADKARGFFAQGMERTADALTSVSKMVGDTADGIDDRVGKEYGDYARKAATALDKAGKSVGDKSPDELIDDTRNFVRKSPGIALAGAAVVGFVLARLVKSGIVSDKKR
ncbi:MAG: hypothetical protein ABIO29_04000 [Sphingomicrobium sp.]